MEAASSGRLRQAAALILEYVAATQAETGQWGPTGPEDLPSHLCLEYRDPGSVYPPPGTALVAVHAGAAAGRVALKCMGSGTAVIGHVGSLTLALNVLCGLGGAVWGVPLPYAVPFALYWDGTRWHCPSWPG